MSWFDIFTVFFLTASAIWSYHRGFFKEAFSLFAIVAGLWVALRYYAQAAPLFREWIEENLLADAASFTVLFILTAIFIKIAGDILRRILRISATMSFVDRMAGGGLGVVKGALIMAAVTYPLALVPGLKDDLVRGSVAAPILIGVSKMALEKLAPSLAGDLDRAAKKTLEMKDRVKKIGESVKEPLKTKPAVEKKEKEPVKTPATEKATEKTTKPVKTTSEKSPPANVKDQLSDRDRKELDQLLDKLEKPRAK